MHQILFGVQFQHKWKALPADAAAAVALDELNLLDDAHVVVAAAPRSAPSAGADPSAAAAVRHAGLAQARSGLLPQMAGEAGM